MEVAPELDFDASDPLFLLDFAQLAMREQRGGPVPIAFSMHISVRAGDVIFMTQWALTAHALTGDDAYLDFVSGMMTETDYWGALNLYGAFQLPKWCMSHYGPSLGYPSLYNLLARIDRTEHPIYWDAMARVAFSESRLKENGPREDAFFSHLAERAGAAGVNRVISYGKSDSAGVQLLDASLYDSCSAVAARVGPQDLDYCLAQPGLHWVMNSLGVLAVVKALGGDVVRASGAFARLQALPGRGQRHRIALESGGGFLLIDESYNANPASMRATIAVLGRAETGERGRRIAVLGDMREMGPEAPRFHAELAPVLAEAGIDLVFACGESMAHLYHALPETLRGGHATRSAELAPLVTAAIRDGDAVAVKGSLASGMKTVVEALLALGDENGGDLPRAANGN